MMIYSMGVTLILQRLLPMPGPTPLPVRLTDRQRAELLLLREDDNSRFARARSHHYGVRRGAFEQRGCPAREHHPGDSGEVAQGPFVAMGAGVCEMRRARVARVLLLSLSDDEREALLRYRRRATVSQSLAARARIVMLCAQGHTDTEVAKIVAMGADTAVRTKA